MRRFGVIKWLLPLCLLVSHSASAGRTIERVAVRWFAPETGGVARPQFIFAHELLFEARLVALEEGADNVMEKPDDRYVRAALERHVGEAMLSSLLEVSFSPKQIADRAEFCRGVLEIRVGGKSRLDQALGPSGIGSDEFDAMLRRRARASLYLESSDSAREDPPVPKVLKQGAVLEEWASFLAQETRDYFERARARMTLIFVKPLPKNP